MLTKLLMFEIRTRHESKEARHFHRRGSELANFKSVLIQFRFLSGHNPTFLTSARATVMPMRRGLRECGPMLMTRGLATRKV